MTRAVYRTAVSSELTLQLTQSDDDEMTFENSTSSVSRMFPVTDFPSCIIHVHICCFALRFSWSCTSLNEEWCSNSSAAHFGTTSKIISDQLSD